MKKKYDYYRHESEGFVGDYFGDIGKPQKISGMLFYIMLSAGYKTTKVPAGSSNTEVMMTAAINTGAHPKSYFVQKYKKGES